MKTLKHIKTIPILSCLLTFTLLSGNALLSCTPGWGSQEHVLDPDPVIPEPDPVPIPEEIKSILGLDGDGIILGPPGEEYTFTEQDYTIDDDTKTVTYQGSPEANDTIGCYDHFYIPNYVGVNKDDGSREPYKVKIGKFCFRGNPGMMGIVEFNDFTDEIPMACFSKCQNLEEIGFHVPPKKIDSNAFSECTSLKYVKVVRNGSFSDDGCQQLEEVGERAFFNAPLNTYDQRYYTLLFSDKLTTLGDFAFSGTGITTVSLSGVTETVSLGKGVFADCQFLEYVYLNDAGTFKLSDQCFANDRSLVSIIIPPTKGQQQTFISFGELCFNNCQDFVGIEGGNYAVKELGKDAFSSCESLQFTPGESEYVTEIPPGCFASTSFTRVAIPTRIHTIGARAFSNMKNLCEIDFTDWPNAPTGEQGRQTDIFFGKQSAGRINLNPQGFDKDGNPKPEGMEFFETIGFLPTDFDVEKWRVEKVE